MSAPQRSPEWFKEREGKLTASNFGQAAGLGPGSRQQLWRRLLKLEHFHGNEATDWGEKYEPVALAEYAALDPGLDIHMDGFVRHKDYEWLGGSPDFLVGASGMGEIKCPYSQIVYAEIPPHYMAQMQGLMQVCDRDWCDFVVWTPEVMSVQRVHRSNEYWDWLHLHIADFWSWVVAQIEPPRSKKNTPPKVEIEIGPALMKSLQPL